MTFRRRFTALASLLASLGLMLGVPLTLSAPADAAEATLAVDGPIIVAGDRATVTVDYTCDVGQEATIRGTVYRNYEMGNGDTSSFVYKGDTVVQCDGTPKTIQLLTQRSLDYGPGPATDTTCGYDLTLTYAGATQPSAYAEQEAAGHPMSVIPFIDESFTSSAGNLTKVWGGAWNVSSGRYVLTAPATTALPNANLAVHNTTVAGDFTLTASGSTTPTSSTFNDFSIVFGYRDPSNYSYASFNEGNDSGTNGIFRVAGGVATQLVDISSTITAGTMYPIRIERQGTSVWVYRGGTLVATTTDASFTSGRVGFGTKNDGGTFDDLTVTAGTIRPRAPSAPNGVTATAGDATATVRWAPPKDPGNSLITGYRVRRYSGTGSTVQATTTASSATDDLTVTGLAKGATYTFDVAAVNGAGVGAVSARSNAVTPTGGTAATVIGDQTAGTKWTALTGDSKRASRFSAPSGVAATRVHAYLDGNNGIAGSQSVRAVVYSDSSGAPATRLASSATVSISAGRAAGWVTFSLPSTVTLTASTPYWIGLHSGATAKVARFAGTSVTAALRWNSDTFSDGAASSFGTASTDTTRISIYASN